MNMHLHSSSAPIGSREELLEFIAEQADLARMYLSHAIGCALAGDERGLHNALQQTVDRMKAIFETHRDLLRHREERTRHARDI
jgi:hypothetical protein